jgi:uncharacterized protein
VKPEIHAPARVERPGGAGTNGVGQREPANPDADSKAIRDLEWFVNGSHGLRAGWSLAVFLVMYRLFAVILGTMAVGFYPPVTRLDFSPLTSLVAELVPFLAMLGAAAMVSLFEHRGMAEYNLDGARRPRNFFLGMAAGFLALSVLVGALEWGGWLHFGSIALSGADAAKFGALWGCAFLVVGCTEEGIFRCFLQFTLARSINFWWALGIVGVACLDLVLRSRGHAGIITFLWMEPLPAVNGNGVWGVYAAALLGFFPCLVLHRKKAVRSGFWQAAWVTSTLFGFVHTGNNGENPIGIFAAAAIGFVFCVSVWVTGSAWWAIGCHAAWDWAETYFYGTADSGFAAKGHLLTTSPVGDTLWSGGADGPEGSLLVLAAIVLLLLALVLIHRRKRAAATAMPAAGRSTA